MNLHSWGFFWSARPFTGMVHDFYVNKFVFPYVHYIFMSSSGLANH